VIRRIDQAPLKHAEAVTGLRLARIFGGVLQFLDPDQVHAAIAAESKSGRSVWAVCRRLFTKEALRVAVAVGLLNILGAALLRRETRETGPSKSPVN
jgi:hypothetical protein